MSYLNPPYADNFKELCAAVPLFYLEVFEMREILKSQGRLMDDICNGFEKIIDDNFILQASRETISVYENFLALTPNPGMSLDERRKLIIATMYRTPHIGETEMREIFNIFCNGELAISVGSGIINLTADIDEGKFLNAPGFLEVLKRQIPAHLALALWIRRLVSVKEQEEKLRFTRFLCASSFSNWRVPIVRFDGSRRFDGEIFFAQGGGILFSAFTVQSSFVEPFKAGMVTFDGSRSFDGSIRFNQSVVSLSVAKVTFGAYRHSHKLSIPEETENRPQVLTVSSSFRETKSPAVLRSMRVSGVATGRKTESIGGSITIDNMRTFDGSITFDGSRPFNANITKEDI
jgi:hypothetical protein